jgi:hypothetical protein
MSDGRTCDRQKEVQKLLIREKWRLPGERLLRSMPQLYSLLTKDKINLAEYYNTTGLETEVLQCYGHFIQRCIRSMCLDLLCHAQVSYA